jgi:8-oxo-dGTP pyrophosphatase MutT (NUDIX family)
MPLLQRFTLPWFIAAKALLSPVAFGVLGAVADEQGKLVLVRQSYTRGWVLPGGGVGRGEAPEVALLRELREEIGLTRAGAVEFFALYTRRSGWATNVVALYRVRDVQFAFKKSLEIRELCMANPKCPPQDTAPGMKRRLAELAGKAPPNPYW